MEAKVKPEHKFAIVRALEGQEYVKYEWRPVLASRESEAEKHPALETREPTLADPLGPLGTDDEGISTEMPEADAASDKPKGKGRRGRKGSGE